MSQFTLRSGLTTFEMLVSACVITLLAGLATVGIAKAQRSRRAAYCITNLRSIGMAFQGYAFDNLGYYPTNVPNVQWEDQLRKYVHRSTFQCPSDNELFYSLGSSYDWRDTGNPDTTIAGRLSGTTIRTQVALSFEALPGWHKPNRVQVVYLDGSVNIIGQDALLEDLTTSVVRH